MGFLYVVRICSLCTEYIVCFVGFLGSGFFASGIESFTLAFMSPAHSADTNSLHDLGAASPSIDLTKDASKE